MDDLKTQIKSRLREGVCCRELAQMIAEYEKSCPMDLDLYGIWAEYHLLQQNLEEAYRSIKAGIGKNPYNYELNRIARAVCSESARYAEAIRYDVNMKLICGFFPDVPYKESRPEEQGEKLMQQYEESFSSGDGERDVLRYRKELEHLNNNMKTCWGLFDKTYSELNKIIGTYHEDTSGNRRYNAIYNDIGIEDLVPGDQKEPYNNCYMTKLECREVIEAKEFTVGDDAEYLLPVALETEGALYRFSTADGRTVTCRNKKGKHFDYYRLPPKTELASEEMMYIGNPVALKQDAKKKKLILNIFLDGFSQKVIEEEDFAGIMPHTSRFFAKGIHCTNVYTAGEWTLPSLATYVTGLYAVNHMLIHNVLTKPLPKDITVLAEYFKEQGYQTAKIDGDWRSTPSYGYGRGMDRIVYQNQYIGMRAEQVIPDVLEHMELMKETNQFIWMGLGDLHDIADGFALRASTQVGIPLEDRLDEEVGITSVKQKYSKSKRNAYIEQMKHVDAIFGTLYRYIEENYRDEEIVVSLFGDHGQGYLVGEEEHFLAEGRSKVGMMFRGGGMQGTCEELISTCDYLPILCSMAGIPQKDERIDGRLPGFFGGEREREYVISESIHPGDHYEAAVITKGQTFYFTSGGKVDYDGRFELGEYQCRLVDKEGNECKNQADIDRFMKVLTEHAAGLLKY